MNPLALLKALRPLQWVKNGLVFLPFVFAVDIAWSTDNLDPVPELLLKLVIVASAFCAVSSAIYLLNDLMDRSEDRLHPVKRHPHCYGSAGFEHEVITILMGGRSLAYAGRFVEVM